MKYNGIIFKSETIIWVINIEKKKIPNPSPNKRKYVSVPANHKWKNIIGKKYLIFFTTALYNKRNPKSKTKKQSKDMTYITNDL